MPAIDLGEATHRVENQSAPLVGHDVYLGDLALADAVAHHRPGADDASLRRLGALLGTEAMQTHARLANVHRPVLHTHDCVGRRIDEVGFHPSYHALIGAAIEAGLHAAPWARDAGEGAHVERAAGFILFTQLEPSVLCPVSMTYAAAPALAGNPRLMDAWGPRLTARAYDPRPLVGTQKSGITLGMGMTEKQGGSDVRANTTRAEYLEDTPWGRCYRLVGHKWFFSAPMSDAHLVLAQTGAGLGCFFLPRILPDGRRNAVEIQRLKDKLGNHANASAEVEFRGALGWLVGEEGHGIAQILEMGTLTRLDCALGTAGLMRGAVALAVHHAAQRQAFGKPLIAQPLMQNVLADMALESEAATALALRLAVAVDGRADPLQAAMRRLLTPVAKFWVCKRGAALAQEAMECLGGNGYVEADGAGVMARIYREMPLNSIWEGAGNIMAIDLLRALRRHGGSRPDASEVLGAELAGARAAQPLLDRFATGLMRRVAEAANGDCQESDARSLAQAIALAVQASLLHRHSPEVLFDAFCRSRLAPDGPQAVFGTLPTGLDLAAIVDRAMPA